MNFRCSSICLGYSRTAAVVLFNTDRRIQLASFSQGCYLSLVFAGNTPSYFFTLLSFTQIMNFFNSCVNPIIYWCLSEQFSKEFRKLLGCNKFNNFTRHHSSTTSSEPNVPSNVNHNTVPTKV